MRIPVRATMDRAALVGAVCRNMVACVAAERAARVMVRQTKREVERYQALLLAHFAMEVGRSELPLILEVGTALGYSAAVMAHAAPGTHVFTLNPKDHEVEEALRTVGTMKNVSVIKSTSVAYLGTEGKSLRDTLDLVFVDGDHAKVHRDFAFFWTLKPWGLLLFHDYSPEGCRRPCPPVYDGVNRMATLLGREPDVLLVDEERVGMAGFYRRPEDENARALLGVLAMDIELERKVANSRAASSVVE